MYKSCSKERTDLALINFQLLGGLLFSYIKKRTEFSFDPLFLYPLLLQLSEKKNTLPLGNVMQVCFSADLI